jgi:hypothetical protein
VGIRAERREEKEVEELTHPTAGGGKGSFACQIMHRARGRRAEAPQLTAAGLAKPDESTELPARVRQHEQGSRLGDGLQPLLENHTIGSSFPEDLQNAAGPTNPHPPMTFGGRSGGTGLRGSTQR